MINNYINEDGDEIVVEENVLYSSYKDLSTFVVVADQSDMCLKNGYQGVYRIHIGQELVQLLQHDSDNAVVSWSVRLLKNFGYSHRNFFIETGSRSLTGPGKFIFNTAEGEKIHQRLSQEVKFINDQKVKSENNNLTRSVSVMAEPPTSVDIIKSKPPAPPVKPRSMHLRNSTNEPYQLDYEEPQSVNNQQPSKKSTPAFGVPVFISLTSQTSNLKVTDTITAELPTNNDKDSNGLDNIAANHTDIGKNKLKLTRSISGESSKSQMSKDNKKSQKELKKQQKKKEEEEKKERKRREEEKKKEQKRKEEEEKKLKKELKKNKQKAGKTPSQSSQTGQSKINCEYSEPDVFLSEYAEVNIDSNSAKTKTKTADGNPNVERIYSEPWSSLSLLPILSGEGGNEVEYAQPEKRPIGKMVSIEPRDIVHSENYSGVQLENSEHTLPIVVPPNWEQADDSNTNLYSHLSENSSMPAQQESVYGIASASGGVPNFEDENPYEDTNILT